MGLYKWGSLECTHRPTLQHPSRFQLTEDTVSDLPVFRMQQQVHRSTARVKSERAMQVVLGMALPYATGTHTDTHTHTHM